MLIEDSTVAYEIFVRVSEGLAGEEAEDAVEDVQRGLHEDFRLEHSMFN